MASQDDASLDASLSDSGSHVMCCLRKMSDVSKVTLGDVLYVISCYLHESFWQINMLCNISGGQFSPPLSASFGAVMEPPAEIVTFPHSCVSNVQTRGPRWVGGVCTVG